MSDSKVNEKKVVGRTVAIALGIICIVLIGGIVGAMLYTVKLLMLNQSSASSGPNYLVFTDGLGTYYAKNCSTGVVYASFNASQLLYDIIYLWLPKVLVALPLGNNPVVSAPNGEIEFTAQNFTFTNRILIPIGARLTLEGTGTTWQGPATGMNGGGTYIMSDDPMGILFALDYGNYINGTYATGISGSKLNIENMEFVQNVPFQNIYQDAFNLNGASMGILYNVVIRSNNPEVVKIAGCGLEINNYNYGGDWQFQDIEVGGFGIGIRDAADVQDWNQLSIDYCNTSLVLYPAPFESFNDVSFWYVSQIIVVAYGTDVIQFNNVLIASFDFTPAFYAYFADPSYAGRVIFDNVACEYNNTNWGGYWSCNIPRDFLFYHVDTGNPPGSRAPMFPAPIAPPLVSGHTYISNQSEIIQVLIWSGTVSAITINGVSTTLTGGEFFLYPGQSINITYSAAPTWEWLSWSSLT